LNPAAQWQVHRTTKTLNQPRQGSFMQLTKIFVLSAGIIGAFAANPSWAQDLPPSGYGVQVSSGTAGNCPSFCTGNEFADQTNGGEGDQSASASQSTYGTTRGSAQFAVGQTYLPELRAYASAGLGKRASTTSFASQLFTFSGAEARAFDIQVDLTGSVFNNASGYASNTILASMAVVRGSNLSWYPSFGTLIYEFVSEADRLAVKDAFINIPGVNSARTNLVFDLTPGESFYVITALTASSANGFADAENTLKMSFDNAAGVVAISAVPEAEGIWMAGAGLLALALWAPRRRKTAASANNA
jgi:hypothetical protein